MSEHAMQDTLLEEDDPRPVWRQRPGRPFGPASAIPNSDHEWVVKVQVASRLHRTSYREMPREARKDVEVVWLVGKKAAGATLDGREWREMPARKE